ncbi:MULTISPECIES: hypothetical protein [Nocardia]|uniref:hypothetical protein n=1 Tax=Nocardia ignorata TaxID=145285 RepID=UPI003640D7B3
MNTTTVSITDITNALTFVPVLIIVACTAVSALFICLSRQPSPQRRTYRNRAILFGAGALGVLIFWTIITNQTSPPAPTPEPSTVEGQ